jgi:spore germination protein
VGMKVYVFLLGIFTTVLSPMQAQYIYDTFGLRDSFVSNWDKDKTAKIAAENQRIKIDNSKKSSQDNTALRRQAEAERARLLRENIDNSQHLVPKTITVNGRPKDIVIYGKHMDYDGAKCYNSYNYERLTYISYHSYEVDANTGIALNQEALNEFRDGFISTVRNPKENKKTHDGSFCKVLLSISLRGEQNTARFLANPHAQRVLIENITDIIEYTDADGIELDFCEVTALSKKDFSSFVGKISEAIRALEIHNDSTNTYKYLFLNVPAYDNDDVYELRSLIGRVDYFLLTGYGFHKNPNVKNGLEKVPNSRLNDDTKATDFDIRALLQNAIAEVGKYNKDMLIVVLPYFGTIWETQAGSHDLIDPAISYDELVLNYIYNNALSSPMYEPTINTYIWQYEDKSKAITTTIYYDDIMSLSKKFDFVLQNQIGGVGLYPLGGAVVMKGKQFWQLLDTKFAELK